MLKSTAGEYEYIFCCQQPQDLVKPPVYIFRKRFCYYWYNFVTSSAQISKESNASTCQTFFNKISVFSETFNVSLEPINCG